MEQVEKGKCICEENEFYKTLSILLRYNFLNEEIDILKLIKEITKSENEFQVFLIYKNYAMDLYHKEKTKIDRYNLNMEETVYYLINQIKSNYDKDRKVIEPYILTMSENKTEVIEQYNMIKNSYIAKEEDIRKLKEIGDIITLLIKSKEYEKKAKDMREKAINRLINYYTKMSLSINKKEIKMIGN